MSEFTRREFAQMVGVCIASVIIGKLRLDELTEDDDEDEEPP